MDFIPLGSDRSMRSNVKFIFATHKDLNKAVEDDVFRFDLFQRINTFVIKIPPLRERIEDIPILTEYFVKKYCHDEKIKLPIICEDAIDQLRYFKWNGNVRELNKFLKNICVQYENKEVYKNNIIELAEILNVR